MIETIDSIELIIKSKLFIVSQEILQTLQLIIWISIVTLISSGKFVMI